MYKSLYVKSRDLRAMMCTGVLGCKWEHTHNGAYWGGILLYVKEDFESMKLKNVGPIQSRPCAPGIWALHSAFYSSTVWILGCWHISGPLLQMRSSTQSSSSWAFSAAGKLVLVEYGPCAVWCPLQQFVVSRQVRRGYLGRQLVRQLGEFWENN